MAVVTWYMEWPDPCFDCERIAIKPLKPISPGRACWELHGFTTNRSYVTAEFDRWKPELMLRVERGVAQR